mgnify:CR=1 FL=1
MCGITGYIGPKDGLEIVVRNLRCLEYRGYDSAGVVFFNKGDLKLVRAVGKMANLDEKIAGWQSDKNLAAIAHTRWATHGAPSETNAHPHFDCQKEIFLVHNGIIENYRELKEKLLKLGHKFKSQTDTEIAAHLIEEALRSNKNFMWAFEKALKESQL